MAVEKPDSAVRGCRRKMELNFDKLARECGEEAARIALDGYEYRGKTIRQWIEILSSKDGMPDPLKTIQAMTYCVKRDCSHCPELNNSIEKEDDCRAALMEDALALLKADNAPVPCKDCKFGKFNGLEWLCEKHSGHKDGLGEDVLYSEWHSGDWYCSDGERK